MLWNSATCAPRAEEWSLNGWLKKIDPAMTKYKEKLEEFHFNKEKALAVLVESDVDAMGIIGGHKRLLLAAVKVPATPSVQTQFLHLLAQAQITKPDPQTMKTIISRFSSRMIVCEYPEDALDLYKDAQMIPGKTTRLEVARVHGLAIGEPLSYDGNTSILTGVDVSGKPVIVKVLDGERGEREKRNIGLICSSPNRPKSIPEINFIELNLPSSEDRGKRERSGVFKALVMPRFVTSLAEQGRLSEQLIWEKSQDISRAMEFIHGLGYVYMDIKAANILITHDGNWVLVDFETVVQRGAPINGYTKSFYPEKLRNGIDSAEFKYDWYMFLVCILLELSKPNWKDSLFNEHMRRVDRQMVKSAIFRISHPVLKKMCENLDACAD